MFATRIFIDDGIALEKDDDKIKLNQNKDRVIAHAKTFIIVGLLMMMMATSTLFLEQGAPKAKID